MGTAALLRKNVSRKNWAWTALSKQELEDRVCRNGQEMDIMVVSHSWSACGVTSVPWAEITPVR